MTDPPVAVGKDNQPLVKKDEDSYDEETVPATWMKTSEAAPAFRSSSY